MDPAHLGFLLAGLFIGANAGLLIFALLQESGRQSRMRHWSEAHDRWLRIHRI